VPSASLMTPKLTTVRLPIYDISRAAVENIIRMQHNGGGSSFGTVSFTAELVVRESTQVLARP
jgi:LacI family transcriptional regulator